MKTLLILTLAACLALGSVNAYGLSDDVPKITYKDQDIDRTMIVRNEMGELSANTFIIGDSACTLVIASIDQLYPLFLWLDLQILKTRGIKNIHVYIDSGGGNVFSGLSYASQLVAAWPFFDITTYAMGSVASAAIPIFLAGEHRIASANTLFMIHKGSLRKPPTIETQADLKSQTEMMDLIEENYNKILTQRSTLTKEELIEKAEKSTWFTAQQAKAWGMVEEIR